MRTVEAACEARGLRLTPPRAQVLGLVVGAGKPIKAYEVLARMIEANGDTAPMTVYRPLDFLSEHGFIHRLASLSAYVPCASPEQPRPVPFLICESCQSSTEVRDPRIAAMLERAARRRGFTPRAQTLEVLGTCRDCTSN